MKSTLLIMLISTVMTITLYFTGMYVFLKHVDDAIINKKQQTPSDYQMVFGEDSIDVYDYGRYVGRVSIPQNSQLDSLILNDNL